MSYKIRQKFFDRVTLYYKQARSNFYSRISGLDNSKEYTLKYFLSRSFEIIFKGVRKHALRQHAVNGEKQRDKIHINSPVQQ